MLPNPSPGSTYTVWAVRGRRMAPNVLGPFKTRKQAQDFAEQLKDFVVQNRTVTNPKTVLEIGMIGIKSNDISSIQILKKQPEGYKIEIYWKREH